MAILSVEHISKSYRRGFFRTQKVPVLNDISFSVEPGEILGITGGSGAGKSTLVRILMGLLTPDEGRVIFSGSSDFPRPAMVFQNPAAALNPQFTLRQSLYEPLRLAGRCTDPQAVKELLWEMQLRPAVLDRYPHQVSGGELQRLALGRLLLLSPPLLLLDEPTSMLDVSVQAQIITILRRIQRRQKMACLFISHDLDLLAAVCHRIGVLHGGRLIEIAQAETLLAQPQNDYTRELVCVFRTL